MARYDTVLAGDIRFDRLGRITALAVAGAWIMARRPGCGPFVMGQSEWLKLATTLEDGSALQVSHGIVTTPPVPTFARRDKDA